MPSRSLDVAQHEAAHVVVGLALGLRLRRASAVPEHGYLGYCWFHGTRDRLAYAIMAAAGLAYEREQARRGEWLSRPYETADETLCRQWLPPGSGERGFRTAVRVASTMLRGLRAEHARVTRALLERDLTGADVAALARGERLSADDS